MINYLATCSGTVKSKMANRLAKLIWDVFVYKKPMVQGLSALSCHMSYMLSVRSTCSNKSCTRTPRVSAIFSSVFKWHDAIAMVASMRNGAPLVLSFY